MRLLLVFGILLCFLTVYLLQPRKVHEQLFFDLDHFESNNAEIVLHKPSITKVYELKHNFSHYITTLEINNTAYVFYRDLRVNADGAPQETKRMTSKDGLNFSPPVTVFNDMPQAHNLAPFIYKNKVMAIGGGYIGDMKLYQSTDKGLSFSYVKTIMKDNHFDSINLIVDKNLYARQWGEQREVHLYRNKGDFSFDKGKKIKVGLTDLYTSGIFKYAANLYVGFPLLFQGENTPSFTKVMYSYDGINFNHYNDIWFSDPNATYARSAYVAPGIFKTNSTWYMYGLQNYGTKNISINALALRPYGLTSVYSRNGFVKLHMRCSECYANIKGYHNDMYVDSLKYKIDCNKKIRLRNTHLFRVHCVDHAYTVIQHGRKGLVVLLSASEEVVLSNKYYQSIGPYMEDYTVVTYSLPYKSSLEEWSTRDIETVIALNNEIIDTIAKKYLARPLILSGISRGGYLASMYPDADSYYLFAPAIDLNQLSEWKGKNRFPRVATFNPAKKYYVYSSLNDDRVNGKFVIEYVQNECSWCTLKIGHSEHSVPISEFKDAARHETQTS